MAEYIECSVISGKFVGEKSRIQFELKPDIFIVSTFFNYCRNYDKLIRIKELGFTYIFRYPFFIFHWCLFCSD